jgi:hypothetical protein
LQRKPALAGFLFDEQHASEGSYWDLAFFDFNQ